MRRRGKLPLPSKKAIYAEIRESILSEWIERWCSSDDCRQSKYFLHRPSKPKSDLLLKYPRDLVGMVARFMTGHAFLRRQNKIVLTGINPPPGDNSCRLCEDTVLEETPHHLFTECDRLVDWRLDTLGQRYLDPHPGWHPELVIKFLRNKMIMLLETKE